MVGKLKRASLPISTRPRNASIRDHRVSELSTGKAGSEQFGTRKSWRIDWQVTCSIGEQNEPGRAEEKTDKVGLFSLILSFKVGKSLGTDLGRAIVKTPCDLPPIYFP